MERISRTGLMTALGGIAGAVSATVPDWIPEAINPLSSLLFLDGSSVHPGLLFGAVLVFGLWWGGERRLWAFGAVFLSAVIAWSAAINTAFAIYEFRDTLALFGAPWKPSSAHGVAEPIKLTTGLLAGCVGAAIVVAGCAIVAPSLRGFIPIGMTILIGGTFGLLLYPFFGNWGETLPLLILFSAWQASVGACLGHWLT